MKKFTLVIVSVLIVIASCKKKPETPIGNSSRTVRYELTGNFTGTLVASYTTASGGTANEQIASIPWSKEITYASNVTAAIIAVSGGGGVAGQKITIGRKRGSSQLAPTVVTANASGGFSEAAPVVVF